MLITNKLKSDSIDRILGKGIPGISNTVYGNGFYYYECSGDNTYYMKTFAESTSTVTEGFEFGDLNGNGFSEVILPLLNGIDIERHEVANTSADSFVLIDSIPEKGASNFLILNDIDGDGNNELLYEDVNYIGGYEVSYGFDLYEDDNGDGTFDSIWATDFVVFTSYDYIFGGDMDYGDVDGDGQDEFVICGGRHLEVYKSTANNTFEKVYEWTNPEYNTLQSHVRCHDFNNNGIDEIIYSGC